MTFTIYSVRKPVLFEVNFIYMNVKDGIFKTPVLRLDEKKGKKKHSLVHWSRLLLHLLLYLERRLSLS